MKSLLIIIPISIIFSQNLFAQSELESDIVSDMVLIKYNESISETDKAKFNIDFGLIEYKKLKILPGYYMVKIKKEQYKKIKENKNQKNNYEQILKESAIFKEVYFDVAQKIDMIPNDPLGHADWYGYPFRHNHLYDLWEKEKGDSSVLIGILDTGIDYNHEDFVGNIFVNEGEIPGNSIDDDNNGYIDDCNGWNWVDNNNDSMDDHGHGTHVAGIAGAVGNNGKGISGVAWDCKLVPLKIGDESYSYANLVILAIDYAQELGIKVLNYSASGPNHYEPEGQAIKNFNGLFITSAGNNGLNIDESPVYPACFDAENILVVGAERYAQGFDNRPYWTNYGINSVDIAAPGEEIISTVPHDGYLPSSGTSMAAPFVAGLAALLYSKEKEATEIEVKKSILNGSAHPNQFLGVFKDGNRMDALGSYDYLNKGYFVKNEYEVVGNKITFEITNIGRHSEKIIKIQNYKAEVLQVRVSPSILDDFYISDSVFIIQPLDTLNIAVSFRPKNQGTIVDTLSITIADHVLPITLMGFATDYPIISFENNSFDGVIRGETEISHTIRIVNKGVTEFGWWILQNGDTDSLNDLISFSPSTGIIEANSEQLIEIKVKGKNNVFGKYNFVYYFSTYHPYILDSESSNIYLSLDFNPKPFSIELPVISVTGSGNEFITIPVSFKSVFGDSIQSAHIEISKINENISFLGIDTAGTLFSKYNWVTVINDTGEKAIISSACNISMAENGILFKLKYQIGENVCGTFPICFEKVEFDNGEDTVQTENGIITITPAAVYGDIDENGRVNTYDASLILSTISLNATFDCQTKANADVTANGFVSALDAVGILMFDARLVTQFPVDSTAIGIVETAGLFAMESQIFNSTSEIIKVPVIAESFKDVFSYELTLQFSEAGLDYLGFEKSTFGNDSIYMNSDTDNGKIKLVMASVHKLSGSGVLGNLLFKARELTSKKFVKIENMKLNESISKAGGSAQILTSIDDFKDKPTNFSLSQNYPNPFNPVTTISFDLPLNGEVEVSVFNMLGAKVGTVVQMYFPAGHHDVTFNASSLSSGVYFYQMKAGNFIQTRKLTVLK